MLVMLLAISVPVCKAQGNNPPSLQPVLAQQTQPFTIDELKLIDKALVDLDALKQIQIQLNNQIDILNQLNTAEKAQTANEHAYVLNTKKELLDAYNSLIAYRTVKRPLFVKIITLSIVRDKHDKELEMKAANLQKEITEWK